MGKGCNVKLCGTILKRDTGMQLVNLDFVL